MGEGCNETAEKIEDEKSKMTHRVLHIIPEDPEIEHIPEYVQPSTVEKHGSKESRKSVGIPFHQPHGDHTVTLDE